MKQGIGRKLPLPCGCCSLRKWLVGGFSCRGVQNVGSGVRRRLEIEHDLQFPGEGIERTCNALTIEPVVFDEAENRGLVGDRVVDAVLFGVRRDH
jgi:hypothetical protein